MNNNSALIIVDMQNDFISGSLAVNEGDSIVQGINELRAKPWSLVVRSRDWHPENHVSFCANHPGKEMFTQIVVEETGRDQVMWPVHCVQNSAGAEYHKDLVALDTDYEVLKGQIRLVESYSAFGNEHEDTGLTASLKVRGFNKVYVCGLAFDYCVGSTAISAAEAGFETYIIDDMTKSVAEASKAAMLDRVNRAGVKIISSSDL